MGNFGFSVGSSPSTAAVVLLGLLGVLVFAWLLAAWARGRSDIDPPE